jgi:hypothetical protein
MDRDAGDEHVEPGSSTGHPVTVTAIGQPSFEAFPKIPRLRQARCYITEKIDGTNAQILVPEDPAAPLIVGSRNRWISPGKTTDNYGFAAWVAENEVELRKLGVGRHYGEWYGAGIGPRKYGLSDRRFALFNWRRWQGEERRALLPSCVQVVPVLYDGPYDTIAVNETIERLRKDGSVLVPGFMDPEGIVLEYGRNLSKYTFGGDGHKGPETSGDS